MQSPMHADGVNGRATSVGLVDNTFLPFADLDHGRVRPKALVIGWNSTRISPRAASITTVCLHCKLPSLHVWRSGAYLSVTVHVMSLV